MISYLIKSGLCLAILLAFYHLVLEREKMHQFNRFYLLGSVLISFLIPFAIIYVEPAPIMTPAATEVLLPSSQQMLEVNQPITASSSISWTDWILYMYIVISSLFAIRFFRNLIGLLIKIKTNEIINYASAKLVLVEDAILPHTFWNYIFINKEEYTNKKVEKELFTHELTHVTQRHTLDVLIIETLQIVLWFNPFFYPLKKAIQLNHEFLADDKVIASHQDIPKYQYLLLDKAAWKNDYYLASNLNYSLTKKRLLMMKTQNSKSTILWKKLAIIPLMGGLFFLFADRVEAQSNATTKQVQQKLSEADKLKLNYVDNQGATKAQMKEYKAIIKEVKKTQMVKFKDLNRARYIYGLMSQQQRKEVENIDRVIPPPPPIKVVNGVMVTDKKKDVPPPPKPIKIEVKKKKKLPPPPPKKLKEVKKTKEIKKEKTGWDLLEAQMKDPKLIKRNKDLKKEEEINFTWDNYEERVANLDKYRKKKKEEKEVIELREVIEEREVPVKVVVREVIEGLKEKEVEEVESSRESYERMVEAGARFYLNGKKVSAKEIKPYFFEKKNKVRNFKVKDNNGDIKVRIKTRK